MSAGACFHCGDPLPRHGKWRVFVDGIDRPVCCPGCQAVAGLIASSGLTDFYRFREGEAPTPELEEAGQWRAFDRESLQRQYVRRLENGASEVVLLVEGLYCAACAWLVEHVLEREPGVLDVQVNAATGRALVQWDGGATFLSRILERINRAGYRPHPLSAAEAVPVETRERRASLARLGVAGLGMMQVMMYAVGLYAGAIHEGMDPGLHHFLRLVSLFVATPVVLYSGAPFFLGAWRDLRIGRPGMDVPVALAVGGAYAASVWNVLVAGGEVYFDSVCMFVFFLSGARHLEMVARHRAARRTELMSRLVPATANRLDAGGNMERVALAEIEKGDRLRVRPGESVPADGRVASGRSHLDESLLTGEFMPVPRGQGDPVVAGSINAGSAFDIIVTRTGADTLVSGITRLLERARAERPRLARTADRVARRFVGGVLIAAAGTALYWWWQAPAMAFPVTLSVLVVTCPCALSLATPTVLVSAIGRLAQQGVLVARADALEGLAGADHVVFDKTGTLTSGRVAIRRTETRAGLAERDALALAAALEAHSEHPIARAFAGHAGDSVAEGVEAFPGLGVTGVVEGTRLRLGRPDWACGGEAGSETGTGMTVVLGDGSSCLAVFHLADEPRPDSAAVVRELQGLGFRVEILSGDGESAVRNLARELGVERWSARQRPEDKLATMRRLQASGHRVVMVGDGVNDAPVLAGADVSVAMGSGSALAHRSADLLLAGERLADLPPVIRMSKRAMRVTRQNMSWAILYNVAALPLAMAGWVAPWMAAIGMSASSLVVVANAARLGAGRRADASDVTAAGRPAEARVN